MLKRRGFLKSGAMALGGIHFLNSQMMASPLGKKNSYSPFSLPQRDVEDGIPLRFRQVHLDFHTSEHIEEIAKDFDPEKFAWELKQAHVDSVTVFAKGCHGHVYYDSKKFPELVHPHQTHKNLLKEQIEACHKQGIRTPIYTVVQWDVKQSQENADWLMLDIEGNPIGTPQNEPGFNRFLCINNEYGDMTKAIIQEVNEMMPAIDGWFIDIMMEKPCFCQNCKEKMRARGLNPLKEEDGMAYAREMFQEWKSDVTKLIRGAHNKATVFYNTGHVGPYIKNTADSYTHLELESLPTGGWGYIHFPTTARYARMLNKDVLGMTGRFHTMWGDFHSLKNRAALEFECFTMLALNTKCSIGDQLHPNGKLDKATYDLIGSVYKQVAEKEPWCYGATPVTEIGLLHPESFIDEEDRSNSQSMGAVRMLQELHQQFDLIDPEMDFSKYKLLILPDIITLDASLKAKLEKYLQAGGKVIASHQSGLNPTKDTFASEAFGLELVGDAPYSPDFVFTEGTMAKGMPETEYVMYLKGKEVKAKDAKTLLSTHLPYFNRTAEHFISHRHAPSSGKKGYPAVTQHQGVIYFAHPIFAQYSDNAPVWCKKLLGNAIELLLDKPLLTFQNLPSSATTTINYQEKERRYVLHMLFYSPERRGQQIDIVEDVVTIADIDVSAQIPEKVKKVTLAPQGTNLRFQRTEGGVKFNLPKLKGHQMIALEV